MNGFIKSAMNPLQIAEEVGPLQKGPNIWMDYLKRQARAGTPEGPSITGMLGGLPNSKSLTSRAGGLISNLNPLKDIGNMPIGRAAAVGGTLAAGAHLGGQALGNASVTPSNYVPHHFTPDQQLELDKLHNPGAVEEGLDSIIPWLSKHKWEAGGTAAGAAALGAGAAYYSDQHKKRQATEMPGQPGGDPELE